jgi:MATE family multidrug resistance protein
MRETKVLGRLGALLTLAGPIMVARAGILTMVMADVVMVGRYSAVELDYLVLALSLFVPIVVTGVGAINGIVVLIGRSFGAGDLKRCRDILRRGIPWALVVGVAGALVLYSAPALLSLLGQSAALSANAGFAAQLLAPAIPLQLLFMVFAFLCEGTRRPGPVMIVMLFANGLNIGLNWILIGGVFGAPAMGAAGATLATTVVRVFFVVALCGWLFWSNYLGMRRVFLTQRVSRKKRHLWGPGGWRAGAEMRQLGVASSLGMFFETSSYAILTQAAGWIGPPSLGAYGIVYNIEASTFMLSMGVAVATAVLAAGAVGARDLDATRRWAWTGVGGLLVILGPFVIVLVINRTWITGAYTDNAVISSYAATLLLWASLWILFDGIQLILVRTGQAIGDIWPVTMRLAIAHWCIAIPMAMLFAFGRGMDALGLVIGATIGVAIGSLLLALRFKQALKQTSIK